MRKRMLALIHIARKQLNLDEDTYRAVLVAVTGKESCRTMDVTELNAVIQHFESKGFKPTGGKKKKLSPRTRHKPESLKTQIDKIRALWIECYQLGVVKDRYEGALNAFVKRMTGIERVDWLKSGYDGNKVVEALKAMKERGENAQAEQADGAR
jgi:phage gp16-like protein